MRDLWETAKEFAAEEDAVGVVEIILILVAIFTHHYSMEKTCIRQKYVDKQNEKHSERWKMYMKYEGWMITIGYCLYTN